MPFGFGHKENVSGGAGKKLVVNRARCPQNHPCPSIRVCPVGALSQSGYAAPTVDQGKCVGCGKCVRYCPMSALTLQ
jgi:ferredoxin